MIYDAFGQPLVVGDTVAWCVRRGSRMWLSKGTILQTYTVPPMSIVVRRTAPGPERVMTLKNFNNVVYCR